MNRWNQLIATWLPKLDHRIWILSAARLLSQIGTGFTLFYAPIFFVNQVGLSATLVGVGIGSGSITGVIGRILGGSFSDSPRVGRRRTLLLATVVCAIGSVILALTTDFSTFLVGNLLLGLGIGLYWPATEAVVADLSTPEQRNEAFALTRLSDSVGLGVGVILGGAIVAATGAYRLLFLIDAVSFVAFFGIIYWTIAETRNPCQVNHAVLKSWRLALSDRALLIYAAVNVLLTTYLAIVNSALPLYFTNFVPQGDAPGFSASVISALFSWYVVLTAITQLPIVRALSRFNYPQMLVVSSLLWGIGFGLIWVTGTVTTGSLGWALLGLGVMAIATVAYTPAASSLVVDLAPESLRGVYLSVSSLCWAAGYFIGPILGGWAMDGDRQLANNFWVAAAASILVCLAILKWLDIALRKRTVSTPTNP